MNTETNTGILLKWLHAVKSKNLNIFKIGYYFKIVISLPFEFL